VLKKGIVTIQQNPGHPQKSEHCYFNSSYAGIRWEHGPTTTHNRRAIKVEHKAGRWTGRPWEVVHRQDKLDNSYSQWVGYMLPQATNMSFVNSTAFISHYMFHINVFLQVHTNLLYSNG
jgi:hypothetical protein